MNEDRIPDQEDTAKPSHFEKVVEGGQLFTRHFHLNGVVAIEIPLEGERVHGTVRQWNQSGQILGSYALVKGTGRAMEWHENGVLKSIVDMVDGLPCGSVKVWDETGNLLSKGLMLDGKLVGKSEYRRACSRNPKLPKVI